MKIITYNVTGCVQLLVKVCRNGWNRNKLMWCAFKKLNCSRINIRKKH